PGLLADKLELAAFKTVGASLDFVPREQSRCHDIGHDWLMVGVRIEAFAFALADRELSPFDADLIFDQTLGRYDGDLGDEDLAESSSVRSGEHLKELSVFL